MFFRCLMFFKCYSLHVISCERCYRKSLIIDVCLDFLSADSTLLARGMLSASTLLLVLVRVVHSGSCPITIISIIDFRNFTIKTQ